MRLSDCFEVEQIVRDASFDALGLSNSHPNSPFLSFIDTDKFFSEVVSNNMISGVICSKGYVDRLSGYEGLGIVVSDNPRKDYFLLHNKLSRTEEYFPQLLDNQIGHNCKISKNACLSEKGITIGDNVIIEDFVRIIGPCEIGDNTIIHSGSIIGGAGYEFKRYPEEVLDVAHCGKVIIGHDVIIWEHVTVHRAVYPWDQTIIGSWSRIGAHSHIDHGAKIEERVEICARCVLSGRARVGQFAFIGPGSIISNRLSIGAYSKVLIGSVVTKDVEEGQVVSGNFAIDHDKHMEKVKEDSL